MFYTWMRRGTALLAAGGMLLSSTVAIAAPGEQPQLTTTPVWSLPEVIMEWAPPAEEPEPETAEMETAETEEECLPEVRFLLRLPPEGGTAVLSDTEGGQWVFQGDGECAVIAAPPGSYTLDCGNRSAELDLDSRGEVTVRSGDAAWDGEQLVMGTYGTLELCCQVGFGQQMTLTIEAADGTHTRTVAYDPALDDGRGCEVVHSVALPAGMVTISLDGRSQSVCLQPGETLRVTG